MKLTICIATHNRAAFLPETLESIGPQLEEGVEVLVLDGASTDETPAVMASYVARDARLRYVRLADKGGVDQDYCRAVELARGEFCWLFTDDDLMRPGAIQAVLDGISRGFELIVVNAEVRDRSLRRVLQPQSVEVTADREYGPDQLDELFRDTITFLSFIGAVVIRRSTWLARERAPYIGTEFVHVGMIFQAPLPGPALLLAAPRIVIRYGNAHWTARGFKIWLFTWPELVHALPAVRSAVKRATLRREPWRRLGALCVQRAKGTYSLRVFRELLAERDLPLGWKGIAAAIAVAPRGAVRRVVRWRLARRISPLDAYDIDPATAPG